MPIPKKRNPKTASALLKKSEKQEIESAYRGLKLETRSSRNGNCRNVYCWWQVTWAHYPVTWGSDCDSTSSCHESVRLLEIFESHGCWCQVSVFIKLCLRKIKGVCRYIRIIIDKSIGNGGLEACSSILSTYSIIFTF